MMPEEPEKHERTYFMKDSAGQESTDTIPADVLAEVGRAMYGQQWHLPLAKTLKVQDRTLRRWINDGCPARLGPRIYSILDARRTDVAKAIASLEETGTTKVKGGKD